MWTNKSVLRLIEESNENDPVKVIREKARQLVLSAFEKGWSGPPFDPIKLAEILKISIAPNEAIQDARILPIENGKFKIEYNPFQPKRRINFSVAHEIAHFLFEDCGDTIRNRENITLGNEKELEFLCNIGASEIILPNSDYPSRANNTELTLNSLIKLSEQFEASLEATFLRFCEVVNKPCGILIAEFGGDNNQLRTIYYKASKSSKLKIAAGYEIPVDSKAYECLNAGWTASGFEHWQVFGNNRHKVYAIGMPPIKRQGRQRVGIFIVPEFYDDSPSGQIYTVSGNATKPRGGGKKIIAQVINTSGGLGLGFGKAMAVAYPKSKKAVEAWKEDKHRFILGQYQLVELEPDIYAFQMLVQQGIRPKKGENILKYIDLRECLKQLSRIAKDMEATVHMPKIGAGQARGDWNIVESMIYEELVMNDVQVTVYVLPGSKPVEQSSLSIFDFRTIYGKK
jgi:Zn-dependent peptidase ImmA (M78 family)